MVSYRDFEKLWEQYQKDGAKRDITTAQYCKRNETIINKHNILTSIVTGEIGSRDKVIAQRVILISGGNGAFDSK